ncbi:hypothetical protein RH915_02000 [Serpentinicella sp. ANB-PHB4]|uniref:hypothetical protein n=1 Tax=Serpentinicella sp. ANB-PHB4 TaxID=3074076 RepID=UPI002863F8B7|nr:hypothetical protein [Serpentinicella sp. ANB-PHB4]MDR5658255.1 hypothetical protein [Serpentinicella sp. ANB-PHB4]
MISFTGINVFQLFFILFVFTLIIIGAYITTKIVAEKSNFIQRTKRIKILEKTILSSNMSVIALMINEKVYVVLQHYKTTQLLDIIDKNEWNKSLEDFNKSDKKNQKSTIKYIKEIFRLDDHK